MNFLLFLESHILEGKSTNAFFFCELLGGIISAYLGWGFVTSLTSYCHHNKF